MTHAFVSEIIEETIEMTFLQGGPISKAKAWTKVSLTFIEYNNHTDIQFGVKTKWLQIT